MSDLTYAPESARQSKGWESFFEFIRPAWQERAACRGLAARQGFHAFYPERGQSVVHLRAICGTCPVQDQCAAFALETNERYGMWGGMSERSRRKERTVRFRARAVAQ